MSDSVLGRWYASEPTRYYQIVGKEVTAYKMYVTSIDYVKNLVYYDSFLLVNKNEVHESKVDKVTNLEELMNEINDGHLVRKR